MLRISGVLFGELGRTGRPGECFTGSWRKSAIFISPGLLTSWTEMVILRWG